MVTCSCQMYAHGVVLLPFLGHYKLEPGRVMFKGQDYNHVMENCIPPNNMADTIPGFD